MLWGMARQPRSDLPGIPQHVVQRGNNRWPHFLDNLDRQRYLQCLRQALGRFDCRLHVHVLMSNHVHLLLTRGEGGALSRLMHAFSRNCAGLFNDRHGRTGALWEGRHKACLRDSVPHFFVQKRCRGQFLGRVDLKLKRRLNYGRVRANEKK